MWNNIQATLLQSTFVERMGWVLLHSLWQFSVVALVAVFLQRILMRHSASTRYLALLAAMMIMVLMPTATWFWLHRADPASAAVKATSIAIGEPVTPLQHRAAMDAPPTSMVPITPNDERTTELPVTVTRNTWSRAAVQPWLTEIVFLWFAGVLLAACRPLLSSYMVHRLRTVGVCPVDEPVNDLHARAARRLNLRQSVQVLQSTLVKTPVVVGYFRPLILLPLTVVSGLPAGQLELILAHELAHIRRHDYLVNFVQTVVESLFFYHPGVWWLSRQIRNERENCCDDLAIATVGSRAEYGRALLAIEELRVGSYSYLLAASGGTLLARIRRIAGNEPAPSIFGGGHILCALLISIAIGVAATRGVAPAAENSKQPPTVAANRAGTETDDSIPPLTSDDLVPKECWSLTLKDAVRIALQNGKTMRTIGAAIQGPLAPTTTDDAGQVVNSIPAADQDLILARLNTDISLTTFEESVRNLLNDVEIMYWELWFDYHHLDCEMRACDSALRTWKKIYASRGAETKGGEDSAESLSLARKQYYEFHSEAKQALSTLRQTEKKLRYISGLAGFDGRSIRPTDNPPTEKVSFAWNECHNAAMARSPEIREARFRVKQRGMELVALKKYIEQHSMDVLNNRGVRNGELALARARAQLQETELELSHQVAFTLRDVESNLVLTEENHNQFFAAEREVKALHVTYEKGRTPIDVLLSAERSTFEAESAYYRAQADYARSILQVHYRKNSLLEFNGVYFAEGLKFNVAPIGAIPSASLPAASDQSAEPANDKGTDADPHSR